MLISAVDVMLENLYCLVGKRLDPIFFLSSAFRLYVNYIILSFRIPPSWPGESHNCFVRDCQIIIIVCQTEGQKKSIIN